MSMLQICLGSIFRINLIELLVIMKLHGHDHFKMREGTAMPSHFYALPDLEGFQQAGKVFPGSFCLVLDLSL